ncbi:protein FAM181B [Clupea harengus]|uniref:Protein FAM181B n=1 Tax=Clupea harengus TaxID=7950 RepID=A0A6P8G312_CLUHA|nr:protein FAM181B [Clupea harengus]
MAVQAAIMNSQFLNFCFPGSVMEFGMEKDLEGGLLCDTDRDEGDFREATRDLLSFIDSASSNIKLALDKPVKSKRKVNHRKYLQKQIKRCTGIIAPSSPPQQSPSQATPQAPDLAKRQGSPLSLQQQPHQQHQQQQQQQQQQQPGTFQGKMPPKRDGVQANLQSKSLAALFNSAAKDNRGERAKKPPLRHRNLPPSFFTEPVNFPRVTSTSGMTLKDLERGNPEASEFFELLGPDYSNMLLEQDLFQNGPGCLARVQQDVSAAGLEPVSYDSPHYVTGGFVYAEPWTTCVGPPKKVGEGMRTGPEGQASVYSPSDPSAPVALEDSSSCTLAFPPFFTDCSSSQVPYDGSLTGGYARGSFSSL